MYKRLFIAAIMVMLLSMTALSQAPEQTPAVRWRTIVKMTSPSEGYVTFKALVAEGWHLYGMSIPAGGPMATNFDLAESSGVVFTGAVTPSLQPKEVRDELFGMTLTWWDSNVNFKIPFHLEGSERPVIRAVISFMACDGTTCRRPKKERIAVNVPPYTN